MGCCWKAEQMAKFVRRDHHIQVRMPGVIFDHRVSAAAESVGAPAELPAREVEPEPAVEIRRSFSDLTVQIANRGWDGLRVSPVHLGHPKLEAIRSVDGRR